jgi:hypothetical protein
MMASDCARLESIQDLRVVAEMAFGELIVNKDREIIIGKILVEEVSLFVDIDLFR